MRIGYHCEGHDWLVLHPLTCRLLGIGEDDAGPEIPGMGIRQSWPRLLLRAHDAVTRFLRLGVDLIVVAADNDGCPPEGAAEDPAHPRHWVHLADAVQPHADCRHCDLLSATAVAGRSPVVVCVAVEAIEAWLIVARGIWLGNPHDLTAESRGPGLALKQELYAASRASRRRIEQRALPLLAALTDVRDIAPHSRSFRMFMDDIDAAAQVLRSTGVLP